MDVPALEKAIRALLQAPGVDLSTISSKRVRKELAEHFGASQIKGNKEVCVNSKSNRDMDFDIVL
jgi:hypothetical protein